MATPDPNEMRRLESEARDCERTGDTLGALDVYEEIVRRGWAGARHLAALGYCYVKNRQRQNAKEIWLRGLEMEPGNKLCREALDKYFPGWESKMGETRLDRQKDNPPPPPPPVSFGQELSVETISPIDAQRTRISVTEPPTQAYPIARPAQATPAAAQPVTPIAQPRAAQPAAARPAPVQPRITVDAEVKVNWDFVMTDVAEEAVARKK